MAALVLQDDASLTPAELAAFLGRAARPAVARAGRATSGSPPTLPSTATNKVLKRELIAQGATAGDGVLWVREERGTAFLAATRPATNLK